ncbi:hypothetical protein ACRALDRAFT_2017120 [Sodiomyces alcalophilus JCM 7366]
MRQSIPLGTSSTSRSATAFVGADLMEVDGQPSDLWAPGLGRDGAPLLPR